jgi:uncharacterized membrane protein
MSKDRVETLSDGVFAVAMTILILGLNLPNIPNHANLSQYASAMAPLIPKALSFALTFAIIAIHWVSHHYFFRHIKNTPLGFVWLNNLFLLWICFMPFPAALLGTHPTDQFPIILFGVNQLLAALTFLAFRSYAVKNDLFIDRKFAKSMGPSHTFPAITIYSLTILLAFVNVYLSLACLLLAPLLYFVPNLLHLD